MDDKTMLELAAKAAGIDHWYGKEGTVDWNPLTDDGDALRLAVKLEITIYTPQTKAMQYAIACAQNFDGTIDCSEKSESDPNAAAAIRKLGEQ